MDYPPVCGLGQWYLYLLREVGYQSSGSPYSLSEITTWAAIRGTALKAWELESVHLLSKVWVSSLNKLPKPEDKPPYESESMLNQRRQRATEALMANRRARKGAIPCQTSLV